MPKLNKTLARPLQLTHNLAASHIHETQDMHYEFDIESAMQVDGISARQVDVEMSEACVSVNILL